MKRMAIGIVFAILLLGTGGLRASPDGDARSKLEELTRLLRQIEDLKEGAEVRFSSPSTVPRVHWVGDLTIRLETHVRAHLAMKPAGSEINEEEPLFGSSEEGDPAFLEVYELIDLVRSSVRPDSWERDATRIEAAGPHGMLVVADPDVQEEVAAFLGDLRERVTRVATVTVRLVRFDDPGARPPARMTREEGLAFLERAEAGDGVRLVATGRITGYEGQRVSFWRGRQRAFVQDYDVEVAEGAHVGDPIVAVLETGLSFDVRAVSRGEKLVLVDLDGELAAADGPMRSVETAVGPAQSPRQTVVPFAASLTLPQGGYALTSAGGAGKEAAWAVLVSASTEGAAKGGAR